MKRRFPHVVILSEAKNLGLSLQLTAPERQRSLPQTPAGLRARFSSDSIRPTRLDKLRVTNEEKTR